MKTLAEFLVDYLIDANDFSKQNWPEFRQDYINDYNKAIEAYKDHLRSDSPKTVHWGIIERDLIVALERMQSQDSLEGARHNNQSEINHPLDVSKMVVDTNEKICLQPSNYQAPNVFDDKPGCVKCKSLLICTDNKGHHCEECLLFDLESQGNCKEPGYGTKADNRACDRFKLNTIYYMESGACPFPAARIKFGCNDCQLHPTCGIQNVKHVNENQEHPDLPTNDAPTFANISEIKHPICPMNLYFEGDEDKCNVKNCDFKVNGRDSRSCTETCKIIIEKKKGN